MSAVELLAYLMDDAFDGRGIEQSNESQSLMTNLATVTADQWRARPEGVRRTAEIIAVHVGACKVMYVDHAFGAGTLTWESPEVAPWPVGEAPMAEVVAWLRETHAALMGHVRSLTDEELLRRRRANWGEQRETRWLLSALLQHDVYHAGEINHLRSVLDGDDRWRWQQQLGIE
jgi:uncharacterized damage-inducible protein DinB